MEPDAERPANLRCSSCGAPIFWALTAAGKRIPMDAEPVATREQGSYAVAWPDGPNEAPRCMTVRAIYLTHFATCPNAAQHRKR